MSRVALRSSRRACASAAPAWLQQPRGGAMPLAVSARGAAAARSAAGTCGGSMGVGPRNRVSSTSCISCSAGVSSCCSSRTVAATRRAGSGTSSTALRRRLAAGSVVASLARDGRGARERTAAYAIPKGISVAESIELDELTSSEDEAEMESFSENYAAKSTLDIVRERTGWLGAFCIGLVLAAGVVEGFDELIAKHVELSFFVPLIMGHGGNSGAQATCAVIRALALKQISFRNVGAVVAKEAAAGAAMGTAIGSVICLLSLLTHAVSPDVGLAVACALPLVSLWANALGAGLTLGSAKLKLDPAMTSAPLVTTIVDTSGLVIYFVVAKAIIDQELMSTLLHYVDNSSIAAAVPHM